MATARRFNPGSQAALRSLQSQPGIQLNSHLRVQLEALYSMQLSDLRLIESTLPALMGAHAFACGKTIVFAPGQMSCCTREGRWLLGHELAHIKQQSGMAVRFAEPAIVDDPEMEEEANLWGDRLAQAVGLDTLEAFVVAEQASVFSNVLQCASAFGAATSFLTAPFRWAWNNAPTFRAGSTQNELNQQNIDSTTNSIAEHTALTRQNGSDTPLFLPPPVQTPLPPTIEEQALAIHKMTLAENMARLSPMELMLRNSIMARSVHLNKPPVQSVPPTAPALNRGLAELQHTDVAARPLIPDARGVMPGSLDQGRLQNVVTREVDFQQGAFASLRGEAIEAKKLEMYNRMGALKVPVESIKKVLPDPIIQVQGTTVSTAFRNLPANGDAVIIAQLNGMLVQMSELEARIKESTEITNLLARKTASDFFENYFSGEINSWSQVLTKLDERLDSKPGSGRVCPLSYATWDAILTEYIATPRDKSRILLRLDQLIGHLDREALTLKYGKAETYYRGFTRQLSGGTGAPWDCRITITEAAWNLIESGDGNADQIRGILTQNPMPIQKDGKTKGNRAIKPEPYGWIFSTSGTLRLTSRFPASKVKGDINWPPRDLVFDTTHDAGH